LNASGAANGVLRKVARRAAINVGGVCCSTLCVGYLDARGEAGELDGGCGAKDGEARYGGT
tara:strand:- start:11624 stop:11806 length:183 start_codon:yes stop_codon:yes gene_type:complete